MGRDGRCDIAYDRYRFKPSASVDLKRALNETHAGKALYSDLQRLLVELEDTIRSLAEQARGQSNLQLAQKLEAELKRNQKDLEKTFSEIKKLKIPFGKRLFSLFSKKARGVRILGLFSFRQGPHFLFEQRSIMRVG